MGIIFCIFPHCSLDSSRFFLFSPFFTLIPQMIIKDFKNNFVHLSDEVMPGMDARDVITAHIAEIQ